MTNKLFMAASVAVVAVASVSVPVNAEGGHTFTDVGASYDEAVSFLYEVGIINGKSATQFGTHHQLTRGDAAVILANALGLDTENAPDAGFTDLNSRIKGSVNALAEWEIVSGVTKTQFKPNEPLSRGAMAKFLVAGFELEDFETPVPFTDVAGVFTPYIGALYGTGITNGKSATSYGTYDNITRGEFANLLFQTFMFIFEEDDSYPDVYYPMVYDVAALTPTSIGVEFEEAVPEEFTAKEMSDYLFYIVEFEDGEIVEFFPTAYELTDDRYVLTVSQSELDLSGRAGTILVANLFTDTIIPFDFTEQPETDAE